jgi:hypothetical protein
LEGFGLSLVPGWPQAVCKEPLHDKTSSNSFFLMLTMEKLTLNTKSAVLSMQKPVLTMVKPMLTMQIMVLVM